VTIPALVFAALGAAGGPASAAEPDRVVLAACGVLYLLTGAAG